MKEVTSVLEFANAAAIERINYELVKVIENIQNVPAKNRRSAGLWELGARPRNSEQVCRLFDSRRRNFHHGD